MKEIFMINMNLCAMTNSVRNSCAALENVFVLLITSSVSEVLVVSGGDEMEDTISRLKINGFISLMVKHFLLVFCVIHLLVSIRLAIKYLCKYKHVIPLKFAYAFDNQSTTSSTCTGLHPHSYKCRFQHNQPTKD